MSEMPGVVPPLEEALARVEPVPKATPLATMAEPPVAEMVPPLVEMVPPPDALKAVPLEVVTDSGTEAVRLAAIGAGEADAGPCRGAFIDGDAGESDRPVAGILDLDTCAGRIGDGGGPGHVRGATAVVEEADAAVTRNGQSAEAAGARRVALQ